MEESVTINISPRRIIKKLQLLSFVLSVPTSIFLGVYAGIPGFVFGIVAINAAAFGYLLPAFVAVRREHRRAIWIVIFTLLFGWSLFGWMFAMWWACSKQKQKQKPKPESEAVVPIN